MATFPDYGFGGPEDSISIDSRVQNHSPSVLLMRQWATPVQRFLDEPQKSVLFTMDPVRMAPNQSLDMGLHMALAPGHGSAPSARSQIRFNSPMSSINPSSTIGSDEHMPPTPSDTTLLSPRLQDLPSLALSSHYYHHHDLHNDYYRAHAIQFEGMDPAASGTFVNPVEVTCCVPYLHPYDPNEESNFDLGTTDQTFSFEDARASSSASTYAFEPTQGITLDIRTRPARSETQRRQPQPPPPRFRSAHGEQVSQPQPPLPQQQADMAAATHDSGSYASRLTPSARMESVPSKLVDEQDDSAKQERTAVERRRANRERNEEQEDDDEYRPEKKPKRAVAMPDRRGRGRQGRRIRGSASAATRAAASSTSVSRPTESQQLQRPRADDTADPVPRRRLLPPSSATAKTSFGRANRNTSHLKDPTAFDAHVEKQLKRPFICVFHFAGCESTFATKNEWKRHVLSQHILLSYWVCQEGVCARASNGPSDSSRSSRSRSRTSTTSGPASIAGQLPNGVIFNRKDLYMQHLKRMHVPLQIKKALKPSTGSKKTSSSSGPVPPEWEDRMRQLQADAQRERCKLPRHMACPAMGCGVEFNGPDAWDQRMEHMARHLDKVALGEERPVRFGGRGDPTLTSWAAGPEVAIVRQVGHGDDWELNKPLKPGTAGLRVVPTGSALGSEPDTPAHIPAAFADAEPSPTQPCGQRCSMPSGAESSDVDADADGGDGSDDDDDGTENDCEMSGVETAQSNIATQDIINTEYFSEQDADGDDEEGYLGN